MIKKILIANRGEIAVRIIRTCKEMNIQTVAIYSTADAASLHVTLADEAVCIGGPHSKDSYLNMENILSAAMLTHADAIHPGFGFLSENSKFARLVAACGLIFIGPDADVMDMMGDKANARAQMIAANVPVVPGSKQILTSVEEGLSIATTLGYPVLIKASSGGGGRGMRLVSEASQFSAAFHQASCEAKACFGDDRVYVEKFIEQPKHIEVQVVADKFGNVRHLYERDCSIQRRNQKMIEEAPCHHLDASIREKMCQDAIKACKQVGYHSVGTIEFLLDKHGKYYFIEMNTRIQVEHPITEMITGIDLIKAQIRIASGLAINFTQEDVSVHGHAMECRINAEDMKHNFRPSPGKLSTLHIPGGKGIRIDSHMYVGYEIPPYYDSMMLKLIAFAPTRLECIKKMRRALEELIIDGVETNIEFHYFMMHAIKFVEGKYDTGYTESFLEELKANGSII
ncbi:MAG: acetyl-CoA carboxylase biotin carboxylase subunit [Erysipelotrichaceae bacterium]